MSKSGIKNVNIVFLTPIILIIFALAIIRGCIITLKINFREMEKKFTTYNPEEQISTYRYGIEFR